MKKGELFQIGDVAKMFHLSVGSLRHYEKIGLISPEYTDKKTGYRYYSARQFEILNTIRYLRVLDMPLEQIEDFLKNRDVEKIREMLCRQKSEVIAKQEQLKAIEKKIENRLQQLDYALSAELESIKIKEIKPRRIVWVEKDLSIKSYIDTEFERSIRSLEESQKDAAVFLGKVGVGISEEKLLNKEYDRYDKVFLVLDDEDFYECAEEIPEETCVTICFCGSHKDSPVYYKKLADYITEHDLKISGFSKEITMIDFGITNDVNKFVTEIQLPIKFSDEKL